VECVTLGIRAIRFSDPPQLPHTKIFDLKSAESSDGSPVVGFSCKIPLVIPILTAAEGRGTSTHDLGGAVGGGRQIGCRFGGGERFPTDPL
jgi:hypothetical protein